MDSYLHLHPHIELNKLLLLLLFFTAALPSNSAAIQVSCNSVLGALLDSTYSDLSELLEKALLLPVLERALDSHNITIFAPTNTAFELSVDPELKRFLLQPSNLPSLQSLILHHILPVRIEHPTRNLHRTLSNTHLLLLRTRSDQFLVESAEVVHRAAIVRPDGVIHGVDKLLVPQSVLDEFNRRRILRSIAAVHPEGAPVVDPRNPRKKRMEKNAPFSIYEAMAPVLAPASAPAPGPGGARGRLDRESMVRDFISTLMSYGGYNEVADILVNLTTVAAEVGRLVGEGYAVTILAPNDEAMAELTAEKLAEPGAPEELMYYHIIPEYQTEESMYNAVRRFGKVRYETLRLPHKLLATEADGSVRFRGGKGKGKGVSSAYLFDPDIYTDGRISIQGIDGVLFPAAKEETKSVPVRKIVARPRRGRLMEVTCRVLRTLGQDSQYPYCR